MTLQFLCPIVFALSFSADDPQLDLRLSDAASIVLQTNGYQEASQRLADVPDETLVNAILDALAEDSFFAKGSPRYFAYHLLVIRKAARWERGRRLLMNSAEDAAVSSLCIEALAETPISERQSVIPLFDKILKSNTSPDVQKEMIVRVLGGWGNLPDDAEKTLHDLLLDSNASEHLRTVTAASMIKLFGSDAISVFRDSDALVVLGPLAVFGVETKGTFNAINDEPRKVARGYVRRALKAHEKEIRERAFEALLPVYGDDFLVVNSENIPGVNPEISQALEEMARTEPDKALRQRAQGVLDTLDQRVRNAIRRRENPGKFKSSVP